MTLNWTFDLKDIVQTLALIAAAAGVWVRLRGIQNQLWLQAFTEYTRRYADAMANMPFEARHPGPPSELTSLDEETRKSTLTAMRRYFNLCSEELYLHERGRIDKETWVIWRTGIQESARWPYFAGSWVFLRDEYAPYQSFCDFMDDIVNKAMEKAKAVGK
jgi:hypothetical protein